MLSTSNAQRPITQKPVSLDDSGIRLALRSNLLIKHAAEENATVVIEELGLCRGQVRVDIAVVNGSIHGYEIKSDRDTLRRLAVQVDVYSKVLDHATLVVGDRHVNDAFHLVPAWWGLLHVYWTENGIRFETIRHARMNPNRDPHSLVELLWLDDAIALLEARNAARGVRGKPRYVVWERVCEHFCVEEIEPLCEPNTRPGQRTERLHHHRNVVNGSERRHISAEPRPSLPSAAAFIPAHPAQCFGPAK